MNFLIIIFGKTLSFFSRLFNLGNGSTWPGHIALKFSKNFIKEIILKSKTKTIIIAGTNGKTTTAKLIQTILAANGKKVFRNQSGANLLNGIASELIINANLFGKIHTNYVIFEIDENALPLFIKNVSPDYLIVLDLFRDQLDRYGEVDTIAKNWKHSFECLYQNSTLILNADDPQIAYLGNNLKAKVLYFGLDNPEIAQKNHQHASDSIYCPKCTNKLIFKEIYFSHLGNWKCKNCSLKRPVLSLNRADYYPLPGVYNQYNILASVLLSKTIGIKDDLINQALQGFKPAFGRQEIIDINGKKIQLFLSKNPTSLNESLRTITDLGANNLLLILNDRIPDGRDVSWIWDVDFEILKNIKGIINTAGDRTYDMALRLKYAGIEISKVEVFESLEKAVKNSLAKIENNETLYILPTYSAMLEVRKILTGKKIL